MTDQDTARRMLEEWFPNQIYPRRDIAAFFKRSESTICRWFEDHGVLTFKQVGSVFVTREELIRFMLEQDGPGLADIAKNLSKYHQIRLKRYRKKPNRPAS